MKLVHGTISEHQKTAKRAKDRSVTNIWSGDLKNNEYLQENLAFIQETGLAKVDYEIDYHGQASYYLIEWL